MDFSPVERVGKKAGNIELPLYLRKPVLKLLSVGQQGNTRLPVLGVQFEEFVEPVGKPFGDQFHEDVLLSSRIEGGARYDDHLAPVSPPRFTVFGQVSLHVAVHTLACGRDDRDSRPRKVAHRAVETSVASADDRDCGRKVATDEFNCEELEQLAIKRLVEALEDGTVKRIADHLLITSACSLLEIPALRHLVPLSPTACQELGSSFRTSRA